MCVSLPVPEALAMTIAPFTLHTRVSDALAEKPALRTLLPAFHPAFERLNHPVLGRVLPKLVTIESAARVAGVDAESLLAVFNLEGPPAADATGAAALPAAARRDDPEPPWARGAPVERLDVSPLIQQGQEPFGAVMTALRGLKPGAVLALSAPFEPAPLIDLLGRRGWLAWVRWEGEVCVTSFWRPPEGHGGAVDPGAPDADTARLGQARLRAGVLDVRGLPPPEPLRLILWALDQGTPLTVLHHREPALLFPQLEARGLVWTMTKREDHIQLQIHAP